MQLSYPSEAVLLVWARDVLHSARRCLMLLSLSDIAPNPSTSPSPYPQILIRAKSTKSSTQAQAYL